MPREALIMRARAAELPSGMPKRRGSAGSTSGAPMVSSPSVSEGVATFAGLIFAAHSRSSRGVPAFPEVCGRGGVWRAIGGSIPSTSRARNMTDTRRHNNDVIWRLVSKGNMLGRVRTSRCARRIVACPCSVAHVRAPTPRRLRAGRSARARGDSRARREAPPPGLEPRDPSPPSRVPPCESCIPEGAVRGAPHAPPRAPSRPCPTASAPSPSSRATTLPIAARAPPTRGRARDARGATPRRCARARRAVWTASPRRGRDDAPTWPGASRPPRPGAGLRETPRDGPDLPPAIPRTGAVPRASPAPLTTAPPPPSTPRARPPPGDPPLARVDPPRPHPAPRETARRPPPRPRTSPRGAWRTTPC